MTPTTRPDATVCALEYFRNAHSQCGDISQIYLACFRGAELITERQRVVSWQGRQHFFLHGRRSSTVDILSGSASSGVQQQRGFPNSGLKISDVDAVDGSSNLSGTTETRGASERHRGYRSRGKCALECTGQRCDCTQEGEYEGQNYHLLEVPFSMSLVDYKYEKTKRLIKDDPCLDACV